MMGCAGRCGGMPVKNSVNRSRVSVIGTGYVGLVTGACLASTGHAVTCVDTDQHKVDQINAGHSPIYEPGLAELIRSVAPGGLTATIDLRQAVMQTDVSFISVGTPFDGEQIDLSQVRNACREIGHALREKDTYHVVVVKSTVVPGTTDQLVIPMLESASGKRAYMDFGVAMNPEFLRQGEALQDFLHPDRVVIGAGDERSAQTVARIYEGFDRCPIIVTSTKTAETIKYAANALLATLISFSNEIANLCEALGGMDAVEVMRGVHLDRRLSPVTAEGQRISPGILRYLEAGCGFGGSCFPKDVKALVAHGTEAGSPMAVLESVLKVNDRQPRRMISLLAKHFPDLDGVRVSVLGLAFKPGTDDMRESPAIPIVRELIKLGAKVVAYDPVAQGNAARIFGSAVTFSDSLADAMRDADAIAVLTSWPEFDQLPALVAARSPQPVVIDGRRILDLRQFERYEGIGLDRPSLSPLKPPPVLT